MSWQEVLLAVLSLWLQRASQRSKQSARHHLHPSSTQRPQAPQMPAEGHLCQARGPLGTQGSPHW